MKTQIEIFAIIADGIFDQVCETKALAEKEKRDLIAMGCNVKIIKTTWQESDKLEEKYR